MTDEIPNPENQPIEAEIVPPPTEEQKEPSNVPSRQPSVLSTLPPEIVEEIDTRLKSGESIKFIREDMIQKYPTVERLKVGYLTWRKRATKLNGGSQKEIKEGTVVKKEMVAALPTAEDIQTAVSKVIDINTSLEDKQAILNALYAKEMQRLTILESKQQNFINPDLEVLILGYVKEIRALLETVSKLQEVLQKDTLSSFKGELDELIRTILTTVYAAYRLNHADSDPASKFDGFRTTLESHLAKTLQQYKQQNPSKT